MRFDRIIIMTALLTLALAASGCAVRLGTAPAGDGTVQDLPSGSDNPFFSPDDGAGDDGSSGGGTVIVPDDTDDPDDPPAAADAVKFITDAAELAGLEFITGAETVKLVQVYGGSGAGFTWTHNMPTGFEIIPDNLSGSWVDMKWTPTLDQIGSHEVELIATDVGGDGASATLSFTAVVESGLPPAKILALTDSCGEPVALKLKKVIHGATTTNCAPNGIDCYNIGGTIDDDREMTYEITGGKPPYMVSVESYVEDSFHCRRKSLSSSGANMDYEDEDSYFFADNESECKDKHGDPLVGTLTRNMQWRSDDIDPDPYLLTPTIAGTTKDDKKIFTIKGRLRYAGPLPISKLAGDNRTATPVEVLTVWVKDSCEPKTVETGERAVTLNRTQADQVRIKITYPEDDKVEDLKFSMATDEELPVFDKVEVFLADEQIYYFHHEDSMAMGRITKILDLDYQEGYSIVMPYNWPDKPAYYVTVNKDATYWSNGSRNLHDITEIMALFGGHGPHTAMGSACPSSYGQENDQPCITDDLPLRWLRFESRYWRMQWTDVDDEVGLGFFMEDVIDKYLDNSAGMNAPTLLNDSGTTIFQRREVPDYRN